MSCMVYILLIWFLHEYPTKGLMRLYIYKFVYKCFSWAGGRPCFKRNSIEILVIFQVLEYFLKFRVHDKSGWISVFSNGSGYQMPCGPLNEFRKTETHSKVRGDCHLSTLFKSGRDIKHQVKS